MDAGHGDGQQVSMELTFMVNAPSGGSLRTGVSLALLRWAQRWRSSAPFLCPSSQSHAEDGTVQDAIAPGQEPVVADHWPAAAPAASSFFARKEGMAAIEGEIAEAGRIGPARACGSR